MLEPCGSSPSSGADHQKQPEGFSHQLSSISLWEIKKRLGKEGEELVASLKVEDISESLDTEFKSIAGGWEIELEHPDGTTSESEVCLQYQTPGGRIENHPIDHLIFRGRVTFEVVRVSLTHMQLGPAAAASYGTRRSRWRRHPRDHQDESAGASLEKPAGTLINLAGQEPARPRGSGRMRASLVIRQLASFARSPAD